MERANQKPLTREDGIYHAEINVGRDSIILHIDIFSPRLSEFFFLPGTWKGRYMPPYERVN